MQEYLDAQDHISKQKKKGWQIAKLGHNIERAFSLGDKIAEISVRDKGSGGLIIRAFYTPVTKALRQKAEGLNAYMHAQRQHHPLNTSWWEIFRTRLESVYTDLAIANRGTLLGPPLWNPKTRQMQMPMEILHDEDTNYKKLVSIKKGTELIIKVDYRETLPN